MTETTWVTLRQRLAEKYDDFRNLLKGRLGSDDLARETLHETWLHLDRVDDVGAMRSPDAYLMRVALNLATDRRRKTRRLARSEIDAILESAVDETPGPAEQLEARRELMAFKQAIQDLSERRRAILIAARLDETPHQEIAERFGISKRMVQIELKNALRHCKNALNKSNAP
jgi:RNA polymerase sigma-70 factor (ECF subfamily)